MDHLNNLVGTLNPHQIGPCRQQSGIAKNHQYGNERFATGCTLSSCFHPYKGSLWSFFRIAIHLLSCPDPMEQIDDKPFLSIHLEHQPASVHRGYKRGVKLERNISTG